MELLKLTKDNYYSQEADKAYFSVSQYKSFLKCESSALARLNRTYEEPKSDALLLGSYVHSWLDGTMEDFKKENPSIFSTRGASKGELKANFKHADEMVKVLEKDSLCMMALEGEKEVIMTGQLFGAPWKIRMDVYAPNLGRFADLKTVKAIRDRHWIEGVGWGSFVQAYGYVTQMAVYSQIEMQNRGGERLENYIVAVSKEEIPDKEVITVDFESIEEELKVVEENMQRLIRVKSGELSPKRCGSCGHCKRTKQLTGVTNYQDLINNPGA